MIENKYGANDLIGNALHVREHMNDTSLNNISLESIGMKNESLQG